MHRSPLFPPDQFYQLRHIHRICLCSIHREDDVFCAETCFLRGRSLINPRHGNQHGILILQKPGSDPVIFSRRVDLHLLVFLRIIIDRIPVIQTGNQTGTESVAQFLFFRLVIIIEIHICRQLIDFGNRRVIEQLPARFFRAGSALFNQHKPVSRHKRKHIDRRDPGKNGQKHPDQNSLSGTAPDFIRFLSVFHIFSVHFTPPFFPEIPHISYPQNTEPAAGQEITSTYTYVKIPCPGTGNLRKLYHPPK